MQTSKDNGLTHMSPTQWTPVELAVVVPTFKEKDNVEPLLELLAIALAGVSYEVVFVDDDSPDGTAALVRSLALTNPRLHVLQRIGRRGLSSACMEGMLATPAPYIAVMDADLQHDERILPLMLEKIKRESLDLIVATRNAAGGSMGEFSALRVKLSQLGRRLSSYVSHCELSDPMSGFFLVDRRFLEEVVHKASGVGFKILLDLVASAGKPVRFAEVPYTFRSRLRGESKLDILVGLEYLQLLLDKSLGKFIPPRYIIFAMVGGVGVMVHLILLYVLQQQLGQSFSNSQLIASLMAMIFNFLLNNVTTYRDRRLRGAALLMGLLVFCVASSFGMFVNLQIAESLRQANWSSYLSGLVGLFVGSVWNYGVGSFLTWRRAQR